VEKRGSSLPKMAFAQCIVCPISLLFQTEFTTVRSDALQSSVGTLCHYKQMKCKKLKPQRFYKTAFSFAISVSLGNTVKCLLFLLHL
jgi:hypothetical protein